MMTADSFARRLTQACGVRPGDHVLAAVSGGADSVALLCLLDETRERLGIFVTCAHVEHGIRGEASLDDMAFTGELCRQKGIAFHCERVNVPEYAKAKGCGLEQAARELRHASLQRIARACGAQHIALAHHALDQAETVLLHAARGSDVRGLCAMRDRRDNVIRPLLKEQPQALRAYLTSIGQTWREDETNMDPSYARNRMRHEVLPALCAAYPGAAAALCRLAQAAQRDESHFSAMLDGINLKKTQLVDGVRLDRQALSALDEALLGRAIMRALDDAGLGGQGAGELERIVSAVLHRRETTVNLQGGGYAHVGRESVCLIRAQVPIRETPLALFGDTHTPFGVFTVRRADMDETGDGLTCQVVDAAVLAGCVVSQRREGDRLTPFGRHTPVKLKKLMIDAGVERPIRNSLPVIRKGEDILWAVGLRPSSLCGVQGGERLMVIYKGESEKQACTEAACR